MKTDQYVDSVGNLSESDWDAILEGAESYLGSDAGKVHHGDSDEEENDPFPVIVSDDERALI